MSVWFEQILLGSVPVHLLLPCNLVGAQDIFCTNVVVATLQRCADNVYVVIQTAAQDFE